MYSVQTKDVSDANFVVQSINANGVKVRGSQPLADGIKPSLVSNTQINPTVTANVYTVDLTFDEDIEVQSTTEAFTVQVNGTNVAFKGLSKESARVVRLTFETPNALLPTDSVAIFSTGVLESSKAITDASPNRNVAEAIKVNVNIY